MSIWRRSPRGGRSDCSIGGLAECHAVVWKVLSAPITCCGAETAFAATHSPKRDRPATEPKWRFDDDQDRALLLRLAARGGNRRAGVCGRVSLHGVPAAYRLPLWRQYLFRESAGAHRGAE